MEAAVRALANRSYLMRTFLRIHNAWNIPGVSSSISSQLSPRSYLAMDQRSSQVLGGSSRRSVSPPPRRLGEQLHPCWQLPPLESSSSVPTHPGNTTHKERSTA